MSLHRALMLLLSLVAILGAATASAQTQVRPRFLIIVDTSGSMLWSVSAATNYPDGVFTHGDGSQEHPGCDLNGDGLYNDSKIGQAKSAIYNVVSAYGEVEFALERFHMPETATSCTQAAGYSFGDGTYCIQDTATTRHRMTCPALCSNGTDYVQCTGSPCGSNTVNNTCDGHTSPLPWYDNRGGNPTIKCMNPTNTVATAQSCIYYGASDCSGGDVLVPFSLSTDTVGSVLSWIDGHEYDFFGGTDKELRAWGTTPLAAALDTARTYLMSNTVPSDQITIAADPKRLCRSYNIILLTDGSEQCGGDPAASAGQLYNQICCNGTTCTLNASCPAGSDHVPVKVWVIGYGSSASTTLNNIASSGGTTQAFFPTTQVALEAQLAQIIANSIPYETCNGLDDNCNGLTDEDWPQKGTACTVGSGACQNTGVWACDQRNADPTKWRSVCCDDPSTPAQCDLQPKAPGTEICDGLDNNCNGQTDEGFALGGACTVGQGECTRYGVYICTPKAQDPTQMSTCCGDFYTGLCLTAGTPGTEVCDGKDNNCNGVTDGAAELTDVGQPCYTIPGNTGLGYCRAGSTACVSGALQCQNERGPLAETCNGVDDNCNGQTDENWPEKGQPCSMGLGVCRQTGSFICNPGDSAHTCCSANGTACMTPITGTWEVCDGQDNDCNGQIDEVHRPGGVPNMLGTSCYTLAGTPGNGPCKAGTWVCQPDGSGGAALVCFGQVGPQPEVCDGVDNDCNGVIDDNLTDVGQTCTSIPGNPGDPPTPNAWPCRGGQTQCQNHVLVCVNEVGPSPEVCDGIDNNCNGQTDEDFPLVGTACDNGMVGQCYKTGTWQCATDQQSVVCNAPAGTPQQETCNGLDDDCNGLTDETDPQLGQSCTTITGNTGVGECKAGAWVCDPTTHSLRCEGEVGPTAEICDGLDNDCDGQTDEDFKPPLGNLGLACDNGAIGACLHTGVYVCKPDGTVVCDAVPGIPQPEICNGIDDNCDGLTDNDVPGNDGQTPCSTAVGECKPGIKVCRNGHWECDGGTLPQPETCDGLDNNCNGEIDEHPTVDEGGSCYTATDGTPFTQGCVDNGGSWTCQGECKLGVLQCQHPGGTATLVCVGAVGPSAEICNGKDDDCDGIPDNNAVCPVPGDQCWNGECVTPCKNDEFPCQAGLTCFDLGQTPTVPCAQPGVTPTCFCIPSKCAGKQCGPGEHCDEVTGACVNPCDPNPCQAWETCQNGACYDCNTVGCPSGQKCVGNQCQDDPCHDVVCGPGQYCNANGDCQDLCNQGDCPEGYRCPTDGSTSCVPDKCYQKACSTGQFCDPGTGNCVDDPCVAVNCPAGFVCSKADGQCAPDPCRALSCDYCQVCQDDLTVSPPLATCVLDPRPECKSGGTTFVTAQGGGCTAAGGGAGPTGLLGLLLALGAVVGRFVRRGGRP